MRAIYGTRATCKHCHRPIIYVSGWMFDGWSHVGGWRAAPYRGEHFATPA